MFWSVKPNVASEANLHWSLYSILLTEQKICLTNSCLKVEIDLDRMYIYWAVISPWLWISPPTSLPHVFLGHAEKNLIVQWDQNLASMMYFEIQLSTDVHVVLDFWNGNLFSSDIQALPASCMDGCSDSEIWRLFIFFQFVLYCSCACSYES